MDKYVKNRYILKILFDDCNLKQLSEYCNILYVSKLTFDGNEKVVCIECLNQKLLSNIQCLSFVKSIEKERLGKLCN